MRARTFVLLAAVLGLIWSQFLYMRPTIENSRPAFEIEQAKLDRFDSRPARSILILGNSRTYYHGMPHMIRLIADKESAPQKYQVTTRTLPGVSFEDLWGDSVTRQLLSRPWDDIILQGESRAESNDSNRNSFLTYGAQLLSLARAHGKAALIVNWAYGEEMWQGLPIDQRATIRAAQYQALQRDHALLANSTNAELINVGSVWEDIRSKLPALPLVYGDGNHPTIAGSYFSALMVYAYLSHRDVSLAGYVPPDISADQAKAIRQLVNNYRFGAGESG